MEMVCENGTYRPFRAQGETGRQQGQRWTSADMTASHQSGLLKQLDQQRRQELFCDCNVVVEGHLFKAHRNVLFGSSGYFRMFLSQGAKDCSLEPASASFDVFSPDTFTVILDFVYSGQLELTSSNVIEVMSAASYLQMNDVIAYCKDFIKSSLEISAKEDSNEQYLCLSDGSPPVQDSGDDVMETPVACSVSTPGQVTMWDQDRAQLKEEYQGGALSPKTTARHQSPPPEQSLEADVEQEATVHPFPSIATERRRRGGNKRKASTTHPVVDDSPTIDLQRASSHKAQKADELYATLPTIVGVVGLFNKDSSPTMRFKCPFCTHTVKRKADLKRHLRCHTGERPYPCQACSKRFTRLEHLRSHFETIHQARKLVCRKCKRHVTELSGRVVCEGTRRYRLCDVCIQETGYSGVVLDSTDGAPVDEPGLLLGVDEGQEENREVTWLMDDDELAEDSGADLIIQEVDDSDEETSENKTDHS
ncbi:zinc finger and BTB domain-containing protein 8A [Chanos chanos]|uniref:Zinc finger and BTB domain-containing protein 8A n=1 Tax=Chanos chanos TaxID=29144 RepID=A0A6J2WG52_CHACN|nr:zinc finger and BTB domain-containing protein 8A [Chanos chanos]